MFVDLIRHVLMDEAGGADTGGSATAPESAPAGGSLLTGGAPSTDAHPAAPAKTEAELAAMTPEERAAHDEDNKPAEAPKPAGAPEAYADFTMPEGVQADPELMTSFAGVAKELGLSQEQAQKLVDLQAKSAVGGEKARAEALEAALTKQSEAWVNEIKSDPEFGGDKFEATLATASKAMQTFGSPELRGLLNESGLGNHPELIKLFHRIGAGISEDSLVMPGNNAGAGKRSREEIMYGQGNN